MIYQEILLELDVKELKFEFVPKTLLFSHDNLQTKLDNGNIVLINKNSILNALFCTHSRYS